MAAAATTISFHSPKDRFHSTAYIAYLKSTGAGGRTIQQHLNVLKIMMRSRGVELKATYRLPSDERKENKVKAMERWFTEDEVQACLDYRKGPVRNQLIIRLLVETGARVQELASLQAHEIDFATRTAWIKTSKTMPRPVFFSVATAKLLEHTISYTKRQLFGSEPQRLFPSDGQIKVIVNEILEELGLKKGDRDGRGPHTFRHYCATWLYYEGGMDLNDVAAYLGDEPATIRENYLHPTPRMMRKRVEKAWGWSNE
jgi:integrase